MRYNQVNAMLLNEFLKAHRKVQEQEATIITANGLLMQSKRATIAKQQKQIEALTAGLQKVSAQLAAPVRPMADFPRVYSPQDESAVVDLFRKWS